MPAQVILLSHGFQAEYECGFANGLSRNGVAVVLVGSSTTLRDRLDPSVQLLDYRGSQEPDRSRWAKAANMLRYWRAYFSMILRMRGTPVHVIGLFSTGNPWLSLVEAWCTRWLSGGYALTVHNLLPHDRHTRLNERFMRCIYRSAAVCMVHTDKMRDELNQRFGVPLRRIQVVEHGIDRLHLQPTAAMPALRRQFGLPPDVPVVLFFGAIAPYKGLDVLLPAMDIVQRDQPAVLVVAGRCRDAPLKDWLHRKLAPQIVAGKAFWLDGYLPDEAVAPLFRSADLLVLPYHHIDQSGVIFMAMATGVPVVASDVGSLAQYVAPPGSVVAAGSVPELAAAITRTLAQDRLHSAAAEAVAKQYLWSHTLAPMISVYDRLRSGRFA